MKVYVVIVESEGDCNMYPLPDEVAVYKSKKSAQEHVNKLVAHLESLRLMANKDTEASPEDKKFWVENAPIQLVERDLLY